MSWRRAFYPPLLKMVHGQVEHHHLSVDDHGLDGAVVQFAVELFYASEALSHSRVLMAIRQLVDGKVCSDATYIICLRYVSMYGLGSGRSV